MVANVEVARGPGGGGGGRVPPDDEVDPEHGVCVADDALG